MITSDLLSKIFEQYKLFPMGIHGIAHWLRVRTNGLELASQIGAGANPAVIEYFAFLHDSARHNDDSDPQHGQRAAELIQDYFSSSISLRAEEKNILIEAVSGHTNGFIDGDITVQICWDADRLDLMRAGIRPMAERLCTPAAKSPAMIEKAIKRSLASL